MLGGGYSSIGVPAKPAAGPRGARISDAARRLGERGGAGGKSLAAWPGSDTASKSVFGQFQAITLPSAEADEISWQEAVRPQTNMPDWRANNRSCFLTKSSSSIKARRPRLFQAACVCKLRFFLQPTKANARRPVMKSGSPDGRGVAETLSEIVPAEPEKFAKFRNL